MDKNAAVNEELYKDLWKTKKLKSHTFWVTWQKFKEIIPAKKAMLLDIGCGMRPRIPVKGSHFLDISESGLAVLRAHGGICTLGDATDMPYKSGTFDLVNAAELLEHIKSDEKVFADVYRILKPGGYFAYSVPMGMKYWSSFDDTVHHVRRYEGEELEKKMRKAGFVLRWFYINSPSNFKLYRSFAAWMLKTFPHFSVWLEENIMLPVGEFLQRNNSKSWHTDGFVEKLRGTSGVIVICQKPDSKA
jgi:SAM-dependent methyltransferase